MLLVRLHHSRSPEDQARGFVSQIRFRKVENVFRIRVRHLSDQHVEILERQGWQMQKSCMPVAAFDRHRPSIVLDRSDLTQVEQAQIRDKTAAVRKSFADSGSP